MHVLIWHAIHYEVINSWKNISYFEIWGPLGLKLIKFVSGKEKATSWVGEWALDERYTCAAAFQRADLEQK